MSVFRLPALPTLKLQATEGNFAATVSCQPYGLKRNAIMIVAAGSESEAF